MKIILVTISAIFVIGGLILTSYALAAMSLGAIWLAGMSLGFGIWFFFQAEEHFV